MRDKKENNVFQSLLSVPLYHSSCSSLFSFRLSFLAPVFSPLPLNPLPSLPPRCSSVFTLLFHSPSLPFHSPSHYHPSFSLYSTTSYLLSFINSPFSSVSLCRLSFTFLLHPTALYRPASLPLPSIFFLQFVPSFFVCCSLALPFPRYTPPFCSPSRFPAVRRTSTATNTPTFSLTSSRTLDSTRKALREISLSCDISTHDPIFLSYAT